MNEFWKTLLIALIPAVVTAIISLLSSYLIGKRNLTAEIEKLEKEHKNELAKLMKQHEIDIDSLNKAHSNEVEILKLKHQQELELKQKDLENAIARQEKEAEVSAMKDFMGGLIGGITSTALNSPEVKSQMSDAISKVFKKGGK